MIGTAFVHLQEKEITQLKNACFIKQSILVYKHYIFPTESLFQGFQHLKDKNICHL